MSKEDENRMSRPLECISDAVNFLYGTFYDAHCNLNPELGFLKADNTSAFSHLSDNLAQIAQQRLVEAEDFCKQMNIDIWELCMEFSIVSSTIAHCNALFKEGHGLQSDEFMQYLHSVHGAKDAHMIANVCTYPLDEESEEWRRKRRATFIVTTIQHLHRHHPFVAQNLPDTWSPDGGAHQAVILCHDLMPIGYDRHLDTAMRDMDGKESGTFALNLNPDANNAQNVQDVVDRVNDEFGINIDPNDPDYDDDPTKGMDW